MVGAQTTEQGDCSKFKGNVPHCCKRNPTVVDLLPGVPYNQQIANCCKGGVVASWGQDPSSAVSSFQVSVGLAGTSNKTVKLPTNFTLLGPGPGYTCGPAKIVPSTVYLTPDRRRKTQALSEHFTSCKVENILVIIILGYGWKLNRSDRNFGNWNEKSIFRIGKFFGSGSVKNQKFRSNFHPYFRYN